jgi:thiamine biosynthesis lipoprotein
MKGIRILLPLLFLLACTSPRENIYRKSSTIMDTLVTITVVARTPQDAETAIDRGFEEIRRIEGLLSFWTDDSEIARVNRAAGAAPVEVAPEALEIIERSLLVSEKTGGAFDATIGPVIRLWDFRKGVMPDPGSLGEALRKVDYRRMSINRSDRTAHLGDERMSFDTGGIAKGYVADKAVGTLKALGISSGLVAIAGDIRAFGSKPDGSPWTIGIRNPRGAEANDDVMATLELSDEAVSTSGDYERFFMREGVRYHHILDPRTGYPARENISVTVVAPEAVFTDGFSTGVFVMGPEKGLQLLETLGYEGIIVGHDGKMFLTKAMEERIAWKTYPETSVSGKELTK